MSTVESGRVPWWAFGLVFTVSMLIVPARQIVAHMFDSGAIAWGCAVFAFAGLCVAVGVTFSGRTSKVLAGAACATTGVPFGVVLDAWVSWSVYGVERNLFPFEAVWLWIMAAPIGTALVAGAAASVGDGGGRLRG